MVNCRVCNSKNHSFLFKKYNYSIVKCLNCGLVFTNFNPPENFFDKFYSQSYFQKGDQKRGYKDYQGEEIALKETFKKRIDLLNLPSTGKVLDVGCAYGYFLNTIDSNWHKFGVEVSTHASKIAKKQNPKGKIINDVLKKNQFKSHQFDLISLWDVIEHLEDPKQTIKLSHSFLKKDGLLAITTGDVSSFFAKLQGSNWHLFNPPQHLSYFSPSTIRKLLKESGFKNIKVTHPAAIYPLSYLLYKLKNLYFPFLPIPKFTSKIRLPVNLRDIMLITAVK